MNIAAYVINLNQRTDRLHRFLSQTGGERFERVPAIDGQMLKWLNQGNLDFAFNTQRAREIITREVTAGEVACTLSHIHCWRKIAENATLDDRDFGLIAEDDVVLAPHFWENMATLVAQSCQSAIDLIVLQKLFSLSMPYATERVQQFSFAHSDDERFYRNGGSALYLMRKSHAKKMMAYLASNKPFWLADNFFEICSMEKMRLALPLLGKVEGDIHAESDLEAERAQAREAMKKKIQ